jgi:hypothetical protein
MLFHGGDTMSDHKMNKCDPEIVEERYTKIISSSQMTASDDLGITQEYTGNRKLWDSTKSKQNYRDLKGQKRIQLQRF